MNKNINDVLDSIDWNVVDKEINAKVEIRKEMSRAMLKSLDWGMSDEADGYRKKGRSGLFLVNDCLPAKYRRVGLRRVLRVCYIAGRWITKNLDLFI